MKVLLECLLDIPLSVIPSIFPLATSAPYLVSFDVIGQTLHRSVTRSETFKIALMFVMSITEGSEYGCSSKLVFSD